MQLKKIAPFVLVVMLTGCGGSDDGGSGSGSGSGSGEDVAPATTNVSAALRSLLRSPHFYELKGSFSSNANQSLTGTLAIAPGPTQTLQGVSFESSLVAINFINVPGDSAFWPPIKKTYWEYPGTVRFRSSVNPNFYCTYYTSATEPRSAALGASGFYFSGDNYQGECSDPDNLGISLGIDSGTWSYSVIDGTPFVCINNYHYSPFSPGAVSQSICAQVVDTNGTLGEKVLVKLTTLYAETIRLANY